MMKPVGVGFLGVGRISTLHILGYRGFDAANVVAVCDRDVKLARRRANEWAVRKVYDRPEQMFEDPEVDMVEVLLPHDLHCEMTVAALQAGKHVSVQKPMAHSQAECETMIDAARQAGKQLRVFEQFVFYPPYVAAKQVIHSGRIGQPTMMRLHYNGGELKGGWSVPLSAWMWRLRPSRCGGGPVVFDHGYHLWSLARWIMGQPKKVVAWIGRNAIVPTKYVDVPATAMVEFAGPNRHAVLDFAYTPNMIVKSKYYADDNRVEIICERGMIMINTCSTKTFDLPPVLLYCDGRTHEIPVQRYDWADSFIDCTRHFVNVLREGGEPRLTGEDGKTVTLLALAAEQSAREGREILVA
jgi:predicted dehydrogenase